MFVLAKGRGSGSEYLELCLTEELRYLIREVTEGPTGHAATMPIPAHHSPVAPLMGLD